MSIKERILLFADYKQISRQVFCSSIGLTYSGFTGNNKYRPINSDAIARLIEKNPDISAEWLITGYGSMLKEHKVNFEHCDFNGQDSNYEVANVHNDNNSSLLDKALNEISELHRMLDKANDRNDKLIDIISTYNLR